MPLFGIAATTAHDRITVRGGNLTSGDVWEQLIQMVNGKMRFMDLDRIIPVTSGEIRNGSKFEDYNAGGPRRRVTVTTWDPSNKILSFKVQVPESTRGKHKNNSWEYEFKIIDADSSGTVIVDVRCRIEYNPRAGMGRDAVKWFNMEIENICDSVIKGNCEHEGARAGWM